MGNSLGIYLFPHSDIVWHKASLNWKAQVCGYRARPILATNVTMMSIFKYWCNSGGTAAGCNPKDQMFLIYLLC